MPKTRIGMLTPSSNSVLEPYTAVLLSELFPHVSVHFSRLRVLEISLEGDSRGQFDTAPMLAAGELLADAKVDIIAWNGTSASWLGFDRDVALCQEIETRTGIPVTSAIQGLNELLGMTGVQRLGLVTPYVPDVQDRIIANYRDIGISIVAERHLSITENYAFCDVSETQIAQMCREVAKAGPDAIAIVCTNMRGALLVPELERELGIPIYDSVAFTLWKTLLMTGADMRPLAKWGRIFSVTGT